MIFGLFTLAVALTISAVAAYYSIAGLCAIFAAAVVPIIIMGAALELGKITATVWLHKYWHRCALQFKLYLVPAIVVLMIITSMGIFGFLSKAHMDQGVTVGDSAAQVAIFDEKIRTEKDNIEANRKALQQMDAQVDQLLGRTDDDKGANRAVQVRRQQAKERKTLQAEISQAQKNISALQAERAPLAAQSRKIEAEVGPIKYIAALIYGDNPDANLLERAVRWVIILLVLVFDPLALVLILAAEQTIEWARADRKAKKAESHPEGWHQEWVPNTENPWYEPDDGPLTDQQIQSIQETANISLDNVSTTSSLFEEDFGVKKFFASGQKLAKSIDDNNGHIPLDFSADDYLESIEDAPANDDSLDIPVLEGEEMWAQEAIDNSQSTVEIPSFEITENQHKSNAGFGTVFPINPSRGDLFLRVDYLPNRLYKWNGQKWIEVSKDQVDHYVHEEEYIKYLVDRVRSGEYDFHDLSKAEQEEVLKHLDYNTRRNL